MFKRILISIITACVVVTFVMCVMGLMIWGIDTFVFEVKFHLGLGTKDVWIIIAFVVGMIALLTYAAITKDERKKK